VGVDGVVGVREEADGRCTTSAILCAIATSPVGLTTGMSIIGMLMLRGSGVGVQR
jgi:hypothetical protein